MKFRRKSTPAPGSAPAPASTESAPAESAPAGPGPYDVNQIPDDIDRVDLGALLVAPVQGCDLRLQVNEKSNEVAAVILAGEEGAIEFQAFAAPRTGGLWDEVRPQIAQDVARRGGETSEREGRFGTELLCKVPVDRKNPASDVQISRIVGVDGPRWMLRATFLGRPAIEPDNSDQWEHALSLVAVRRGDLAMPLATQLPFVMPPEARRSE
ncbi:DUF3710 domain-containing protein [Nocardioides gilvus]|uniref:DUF3710 domain-containing protein n=1 Tax=Nocardioides gilvus TaxID=1735589 RepID=UPI000D7460B9|nr:DUF3710 domain-containing protein [Nocardioides gilvus]